MFDKANINERAVRKRFDYTNLSKTQKYLEKMAENGWILNDIVGSLLYFKKCEPKKVRFLVDVFEGFDKKDVNNDDNIKNYISYCEESGWVHAASDNYMQFFYTEKEDVVPIKTDKIDKVKKIWKVSVKKEIKERVFPCIFFSLFVIFRLVNGEMLSESLWNFIAAICMIFVLGLFVELIINAVMMVLWKRKALKIAEEDGQIPDRKANFIKMISSIFAIMLCMVLVVNTILSIKAGVSFKEIVSPIIVSVLIMLIPITFFTVKYLFNRNNKYNPDTIEIGATISTIIVILIVICIMNGSTNNNRFNTIVDKNGEYYYCTTVPCYFDKNGNLCDQPKSVKERIESGIRTEIFESSRFIVNYNSYIVESEDGSIYYDYEIIESNYNWALNIIEDNYCKNIEVKQLFRKGNKILVVYSGDFEENTLKQMIERL